MTTGDGTPVPLTRFGAKAYARPPIERASMVTLKAGPGEALRASLPLARIYDMSLPGNYRLTVEAYVYRRDDADTLVKLRSQPIPIPHYPALTKPVRVGTVSSRP